MLSMLGECLHVGRSGYSILSTRVSTIYSMFNVVNHGVRVVSNS
nr:MAG TPA: hypothetical protein [Caudoviricetes sp.]